jgi:hypothetical protein
VSQAWKRKYIDMPVELCAMLAQQAIVEGISQRRYIELAIEERLAQAAKDNAARTKLQAKRKKGKK